MTEWISVEDRLPEYTTQVRGSRFVIVIANCNGGGVGEAMYEEGVWTMLGGIPAPITHWMPLPDPPRTIHE